MAHKRLPVWLNALLYALVMLGFFAFAAKRTLPLHKPPFFDAQDYAKGVRALAATGDPYSVRPGTEHTGFIYPPVILKLCAAASHMLPHQVLWVIYTLLLFAAFVATPWLLWRLIGKSDWFSAPVAAVLFVFQPGLQSLHAFLSGNISGILYALLLATAFPGINAGNWAPFYCTVFAAAIVKPMFLTWLLLPLLAGQRQALKAALLAAAVCVAYLVQRWCMPHLFTDFSAALSDRIAEHYLLGTGLVYAIYEHLHHRAAFMQWTGSLVADFIVTGTLALLLWHVAPYRGRPYRRRAEVATLWIPALITFAVVANPRPIEYDHHVGFVAAAFVMVEWVRTLTNNRTRLAAIALLAGLIAALWWDDIDSVCIGVELVAVLLVIVRCLDLRGSAGQPSSQSDCTSCAA